jgi:hypothetical protein
MRQSSLNFKRISFTLSVILQGKLLPAKMFSPYPGLLWNLQILLVWRYTGIFNECVLMYVQGFVFTNFNTTRRHVCDGRVCRKASWLSVISNSRHGVDEISALLGHYAVPNGNPLTTFWDNVSVPSSRVYLDYLTLEDETDMLSRNVGKGLIFDAAWCPTRAQICKIIVRDFINLSTNQCPFFYGQRV